MRKLDEKQLDDTKKARFLEQTSKLYTMLEIWHLMTDVTSELKNLSEILQTGIPHFLRQITI